MINKHWLRMITGILGVLAGASFIAFTVYRMIIDTIWYRAIEDIPYKTLTDSPINWISTTFGLTFGAAYFIVSLMIVIREFRRWRSENR